MIVGQGDRIYPSKKDAWIVGILWLVIVASLVSAVAIAFSGMSLWSIVLQELLVGAVIVFCLSLLRNTYYTLTADSLIVRTGPIRETIPIAVIESVTPSRAIWSSAALSMDRLHVQFQGSRFGTYIAPEDKAGFLQDLASRSPELVFEVNRVIKRVDS